MIFINEQDFYCQMQETVIPYLQQHKTSGTCVTDSGNVKLYYEAYTPEHPKASIVISHGFSESIQKYKEMIYYFLRGGYQVFLADHRGHGFSSGENADPRVIHASDFDNYVRDLHTFVKTIVSPASQGIPRYLLGHSMGGAIAAAYLEEHPGDFEKAILTAPMLRINTGKFPEWASLLFALFKVKTGHAQDPLFGQTGGIEHENFPDSCSLSEERFLWYLSERRKDERLTATVSSYGWVAESLKATHRITDPKNCGKIQIPVLLFLAGRDTMVTEKGIRLFANQVKDSRVYRFDEGKHELYNMKDEDLKKYYTEIFKFFE